MLPPKFLPPGTTALACALFLAGAVSSPARAQPATACLHAGDFYAAPASGLASVDMPPARIEPAVIPGSPPTPALLEVTDCDGDGDLDAWIPWSEAGALVPASIEFRGACGSGLPTRVAIDFTQGVGTVTFRAYTTASSFPFSARTTSGTGAHTVRFFHPSGIRRLKIVGAEICIREICFSCEPLPAGPLFIRGDSNGDGKRDISDPLSILGNLFLGAKAPGCLDAADSNDDGALDITDGVGMLAFLFLGSAAPPGGPGCSEDEIPDSLDCQDPSSCEGEEPPPPDEEAALFAIGPPELPATATAPETPVSLSLQLVAGKPIVLEGKKGKAIRETGPAEKGVRQTTGRPDISRRLVTVALPYDADPRTLRIDIPVLDIRPLPLHVPDVRPVSREASFDPDDGVVEVVSPEGVQLDDQGRDVSIYGQDGAWPELPLEVQGFSKLRKYRLVRLLFSPFQWNPATGQIFEVARADLTLSWEKIPMSSEEAKALLADPGLLHQDDLRFENVEEANSWYALADLGSDIDLEGAFDYVIVTTRSIRFGSAELSEFVSYKEDHGHSVAVVTVESIVARYPASERADSIREFLQDKHDEWGIVWLLLIGDPDPYDKYAGASDDVGSVPMKMAWPRGDGKIGEDDDGDPEYGYCPTDHYYGDLSDDWDVDGDGYAASVDDDYETESIAGHAGGSDYTLSTRTYGIDFDMELKVGRIPFDDADMVDVFLSRLLNYFDNSSDPSTGRSRAYVACSFYDADTDMAYLGRQLQDEVLDPEGLTTETFYQAASSFNASHILEDTALIDEWENKGAGLVLWVGHGSQTSASIGYDDTPSDDGHDHWDGTIMNTSYASGLIAPNPFVFQASCQNAWAENPDNLAHTMLYEIAVGTIAGTRNSWYAVGDEEFGSGVHIGDLAYRAMKWIAKGRTAGFAIQEMRSECDPDYDGKHFQNLMTYNLYGDPNSNFVH
jgi:hypothetical protein